MALAPLAGLIPGVAAGFAAWLGVVLGLWIGLIAVIVIGVFALTTRGLHLDGLADTADGLSASYDREKALSVMRRGDVGPSGLATIVLVLLVQTFGLVQLFNQAGAQADSKAGGGLRIAAVVVLVAVAARVAIPVACVRGVPAARPEGLGATVAGSVTPNGFGLSLFAAAAACALLGHFGGFDWWRGAFAVALVVAATYLLTRRATSRFGGITGDTIGASVEIGSLVTILTLNLGLAGY
jgi:adenosylcobinamide-GDP ribazoletransferase